MFYPSYSNKKNNQDNSSMFWVFCFYFDLLFVSSIWAYGVGMGPDLFVALFAEKALMGSLG
jgi:hypothetical protein